METGSGPDRAEDNGPANTGAPRAGGRGTGSPVGQEATGAGPAGDRAGDRAGPADNCFFPKGRASA